MGPLSPQGTREEFVAIARAAYSTWGPIGVYIIAKAALVLRADAVRQVQGISSVFVFGPRNSGKTQLQSSILAWSARWVYLKKACHHPPL